MWDSRFEALLRQHLPFLADAGALGPDSDLRDLGLDSIGMVELLASLETSYQVKFRDEMLDLRNFSSPSALWSTLSASASN